MSRLEQFGHGGDWQTASVLFGFQASELLDFSANINPLGPPEEVVRMIREQWASIVHYPDPAHRAFRRTLANRINQDPENILVGNGAAECMALVVQAMSPKRIGVIYPCFSEYTHLAKQFGSTVKGIYGKEENGFKANLDELKELIKEVDLLFVGHPNNPTGITYQRNELLMMAAWASEFDTYLVVDEAFLDFLPPDKQVTLLPDLSQYPKVILIRSMTKFYAIPGLRLGYAIADSRIIKQMKSKQLSWSVNQLALLAGEGCFQNASYEESTRKLIDEERGYLIDSIQNRFGWKVWPGEANFLLIRTPEKMKVNELQYSLGKKGIMIRSCSEYEGLTHRDFRIAVRTRTENDRLLNALQEVLEEGGLWGKSFL